MSPFLQLLGLHYVLVCSCFEVTTVPIDKSSSMLIWGKPKNTLVYKPDSDHQWPIWGEQTFAQVSPGKAMQQCNTICSNTGQLKASQKTIAFKDSRLCTQSWELEPVTIPPWGCSLKITIICLMHLIYILPEEPGPEHKTTVTRKVKPLKSPHEGK